MPQQDTSQIKERIVRFLRLKGPSLPVHIAKESQQSTLFASAFLSELYSEKIIKISNMKVGSSPLYFLPGQEPLLEKFSQFLNSKEREAFSLLHEKKVLKDKELEPAIRVALRSLQDFAVPLRRTDTNEIYWKYMTLKDDEIETYLYPKVQKSIQEIKEIPEEIISPKIQEQILIVEKKDEVILEKKKNKEEQKTLKTKFESPLESKKYEKKPLKEKPIRVEKEKRKKKSKNHIQKTQDEKFFNRVKEYLTKNNIEIIDIIGLSKNKLTLKVKEKEKELLFIAFNQRKIMEKDIIEAGRRAKEFDINYSILSFGEPSKALQNIIEASKSLYEVKKIE